MPTFSEKFGIGKSQAELDFVDVSLDGDLPLFLDPFALSQRRDSWSMEAHATLVAFVEAILGSIRNGTPEEARLLLSHLREPNETRLGLSVRRPRGAGIGPGQANDLYNAFAGSAAIKTGVLSSLEECELMIDGIGRDKISDLTTNVLRAHLAEYSTRQCTLWGVPVKSVALPPWFNSAQTQWESGYFDLPVNQGEAILLVPKAIVRYDLAYNHKRYYSDFVLAFLRAEALSGTSSLALALQDRIQRRKNGTPFITKKAIMERFPISKKFLFEFSRDHPAELKKYRSYLEKNAINIPNLNSDSATDAAMAEALATTLKLVPPGEASASEYHRLMVGVVELLFFPDLLNPRREEPIHQGRKRIDIVMENSAMPPSLFWRIDHVHHVRCPYVVFECKNYADEVANEELDQTAGRFSPTRGRLGFILCRKFANRARFAERCRDTFRDDRGLILPVDDETILRFLSRLEAGRRDELDQELSALVREIAMS